MPFVFAGFVLLFCWALMLWAAFADSRAKRILLVCASFLLLNAMCAICVWASPLTKNEDYFAVAVFVIQNALNLVVPLLYYAFYRSLILLGEVKRHDRAAAKARPEP